MNHLRFLVLWMISSVALLYADPAPGPSIKTYDTTTGTPFLIPISNLTWKSHTNERFGMRISYPAHFKSGRMPDNGAGQTFSDGKFSLCVQGHFTGGSALEEFWKQSLSDYGNSITYKLKKKDWFVVSGVLPDGTEFYKKLHLQGGNWAGFTATYPQRMNKTYDPIVAQMAKSFLPFLQGSFDRIP